VTFLQTLLLASVLAQTPLAGTVQSTPPPDALAPDISQKLGSEGVRVDVSKGATVLEFWWVSPLPVKSGGGAPSWADVEEGSLVGAVKVPADFRDIRGRVIKPGVYTLRYGIQPQNGDHLGVSPFREFLLLSPAAADKDPAPKGHDGTIELSKQSIGGSHPGVWSLDPPVTSQSPLSVHKTEMGHDAIVMQVPVSRDGKPSGALKFGLVLIGKIEV
jgi:hypothetical protein